MKAIEGIIIIDIKSLCVKEEDYYKPERAGNFHNNNYTEYESNGDKNKTIPIKEYLDQIKPYLKDINNLKKSDT